MEFQITLNDKLSNFTDYVVVKQTQDNGVLVGEYKMSLNDILHALSNASQGSGEMVKYDTPFIPNNCVKFIMYHEGNYEAFIEIPKKQWQVNFKEKTYMLGFPRLIFKYFVKNNRIVSLDIVAVKDKGVINGETDVYYFPYSNVHHQSGRACMGMNTFPNIECATHLEKMHILFFTSPFGLDYGAMALGMDIDGLLKKFQDKPFSDDVLMPSQKTLNEFFLI